MIKISPKNINISELSKSYCRILLEVLVFTFCNILGIVCSFYLRSYVSFDLSIVILFLTGLVFYEYIKRHTKGILSGFGHFVTFSLSYLAIYLNLFYFSFFYISKNAKEMSQSTFDLWQHITLVLDVFVIFVEDFLIFGLVIQLIILCLKKLFGRKRKDSG